MKGENAFFRQLLFLVALVAIGVILFRQLDFFVGSFLGAITIYVVLRRTMFRMVEKQGILRWAAALMLVSATALVMVGFGYILVKAVGSEVDNIDMPATVDKMRAALRAVNHRLGSNIIPHDIISRSDDVIKAVVNVVLNTTYSFTANILMMLIVLYFMLTGGRRMEEKVWAFAPFEGRSLNLIRRETKTMIYSNAVGMPIILVLQTLVSTLIYWVLGFEDSWFWGFLTALCGLVPAVGTMIVYLPVAVWLIVSGEVLSGVILFLYGAVIISNVDNVLRIVLLHKVADTHPLVVIFGVILGIPLFGFWGIIFGPLFISGAMLLVKIYYMEYGLLDDLPEDAPAPPRKAVPFHFRKIHAKIHGTATPKDGATTS
jgi:predicted PurR-regulated permease PerM